MSDSPRIPAEPADTTVRTLARIQSEIVTFGSLGGPDADEVLAKIAQILAAAGYDVPGALVERFQVLWSDPSQGPD